MKKSKFVASTFALSLLLLAGCGSTTPVQPITVSDIVPEVEESNLVPLEHVNYDYNFALTFPAPWQPLFEHPKETGVEFAPGITADRVVMNSTSHEERILNVYILAKDLKENPAVKAKEMNYLGENDTQVFFAEAAPEVQPVELAKILATFKFTE